MISQPASAGDNTKTAIFAGGCFWCMEPPFEVLDGVLEVNSGYTGGEKSLPSYEEVSSGKTGHFEAVEIVYDPSKISYWKLLEVFWGQIDPTDSEGQFADKGSQYKTAIFYLDEKQKELAEKSKEELSKSGRFDKPIATKILPFKSFFPAEQYHQDYYKKNPEAYNTYKILSGRAKLIKENKKKVK
ncbi:peptide-methionine (S)-S-oxide reductase [candidate division WOR-1 bacterium RIFOXYA12_FULL_43_27]|uniref:Peptide methionine sulfoxide reductase MsrA n=1 Tax=candidate division WOR-1 bacterium RIFOXYC2_FULL_46_14 TaxID=1802587 RepID=A0A1F4U705_UNCSA|nr:MAG: peptide-methionine (S)-S-oxide reductase [candidate division WOR-1 bacterium RIFOXYA12_FULL_43_27]OGC19626.1 MAG: peptide-methionine (S)-S-oxide reductase [candidate division WOR-1 bacterium RIFOXYB2_FULL_46_45]OGC30614.1 MAG: peptide-methionine (S)-S-oxide reductase [candidate division WOR-1 bacterium RIFOXYA2_FULL_46_56]OGC40657.1 MAG: peptide-methionine (S)-S-oxide reductase [candidate division WOR-1 bacterium RIFOXYC2_FULL_46_14]